MSQTTPDQHRAWRLHGHGDLRLEAAPSPVPAAGGVVVEAARRAGGPAQTVLTA
ncbi:MAG: hypothetical protein ACRC20_13715 [Segniliparus sp.]|uniref:hypothetical protein n=1 Tax=Segniliparus sp. TaxID=2804064 RepID=UPI003F345C9D